MENIIKLKLLLVSYQIILNAFLLGWSEKCKKYGNKKWGVGFNDKKLSEIMEKGGKNRKNKTRKW